MQVQKKLSTAEVRTLEAISREDECVPVSRSHLERLYRMGLIEPSDSRVQLSLQGKDFLFGTK